MAIGDDGDATAQEAVKQRKSPPPWALGGQGALEGGVRPAPRGREDDA